MTASIASGPITVAYGDHDDTVADLWLPSASTDRRWPVVVLIHGGFWRERYVRALMDPLVPSLVAAGRAVWNVEYRRVGRGGGYPTTLHDVAAAVDHLAAVDRDVGGVLDLGRVSVVGHSAGGQLALWVASRSSLPSGALGSDPVVAPTLAVGQAAVSDLIDAAGRRVGDTAVIDLMGAGPDDDLDRYLAASPVELLPIDVPVLLVHGVADDDVPLRQSERYRDAALAAGVRVELVVDPDAGHYEHLDPGHRAWRAVLDVVT